MEVVRVGSNDRLIGAACANDDVGVGDVSRPTGGQQPADIGCVDPAKADDIGGGLADQPG
jgi:hypothetical protein